MKDIYALLEELGLAHHRQCEDSCSGKRFEIDGCIALLQYFQELIKGIYDTKP